MLYTIFGGLVTAAAILATIATFGVSTGVSAPIAAVGMYLMLVVYRSDARYNSNRTESSLL